MKQSVKKEEGICEIIDSLKEGIYYVILTSGEKIRVRKNNSDDIESHRTGILTTWRMYDDEYPELIIEDWGWQEIHRFISSVTLPQG